MHARCKMGNHVVYIYCFVYLYLSLLFNLKLADLCEWGNYSGLCGVLTRVLLRGGGEGGLELMSN